MKTENVLYFLQCIGQRDLSGILKIRFGYKMTYIEAIKDGFRLVHRNWQLVLVQIGMAIINFTGFFIIVGIPFAIAFIIFGVDLTGLTDVKDIFRTLRDPSDIISRYLGLFLIVIASFLLYIIMVAMFGIYIFGGSIGVIGRSLRDRYLKFSMHTFFDEAKRLFLRVLGFISVIGLIFIVAAFFLGLLGGGIAAIVSFAQSQDSTLALFLGTFFSLILIIIAFILTLGILSITLYGIASLSFKRIGPLKSLWEAIHYLARHPKAFWLYAILFGGYVLTIFLLILLSYPFTLIPVIGTILSFPYQLILYSFQTYLFLVIIATVLTYYYSTEIPTEHVVESPISQPSAEEEVTIQDQEKEANKAS
ncbi:MAG: hypothetical protein COY75_07530 [Nitrospirae bacterium CG_4_10_14_0_8_um_filter_41_23]|nr:hypothetical protein [Nitrospirota bacterium]OIP61396.1 MAG: hypothetical protein AUK38_00980 [Nitrospirae bacterium CG2_30_41_42]PIQ94607.1 MAG: hypothetical protein COV68_03895 [Nitrospirae bacterium CG11_big_fil_rev_8_21_14_0_20_41_14]PIV41280.1 MAG: hypothetical protein COS27_09985 [Nitrospirae bacterium CG02_land_8_20_14_3_00_41_53]PIW87667.1 MAG: hypothetical protein COZ94_03675 [Nitrospirae bacterium CG_4_8_14_3_um_filter_41_47]PIY86573.1 MAG: hypothetical protein COY75_07530 [Nitros